MYHGLLLGENALSCYPQDRIHSNPEAIRSTKLSKKMLIKLD